MKMKNIVKLSVIVMFIMLTGNIASAMDVPVYKQGTPSVWAGDQLGTCASTIGTEGCAVTSVEMVFKYYGVQTDPRDLNNWLKGNNGYTNGCWIRWDIAAGRSGGTVQFINQYSYPNPLTTAELNLINSELDSGYPVIAEVRTSSGSQHFVVITGRSGSTYNINDPANGDKSTLNARYGNPSTAIWGIRLYHGSAAPAISILDASISPNVASPGDTLTFVYSINNPGTSNVNNVRLGARIRTYSPQGVWIDNWDNDKIEIIYPGTRNYERNFQVPSTASIGLYDAQWVLVNNADETWYTSWLSSPILTIQAQTGTISVTTNNPSATFTVTGPATYTGSGSSWTRANAPVGTYSITFASISGKNTPSDTSKTLTNGGSITFSGTYTDVGTIVGDLNGDGKVDMDEIFIAIDKFAAGTVDMDYIFAAIDAFAATA
ncbi:hypothetical protein METP3_01060 [Methanosarcinales archaeon]|nr:hypothetical protein METP3_01060 [Methanosarcinales archaeon]